MRRQHAQSTGNGCCIFISEVRCAARSRWPISRDGERSAGAAREPLETRQRGAAGGHSLFSFDQSIYRVKQKISGKTKPSHTPHKKMFTILERLGLLPNNQPRLSATFRPHPLFMFLCDVHGCDMWPLRENRLTKSMIDSIMIASYNPCFEL